MSKRKRDPTFTSSEKNILLELVEKYFIIVESKKTDVFSIKNKNEHWKKIALEFNSISGIHPREWTILKNCWENMKKRAKQEHTQRNQHFLGTGGGPPLKAIDDPITDRVLELIQDRVSGFVNVFDSDGTQIIASCSTDCTMDNRDNDNSEPQNDARESQENNIEEAISIDDVTNIDWSQYTPSMLKEPVNPILQAKSPCPSTTQKTQHNLNTPLWVKTKTRHRRPFYNKGDEGDNLNTHKINTLRNANTYAEEEHKMHMKILRLQEQQEEIRLEILQLQLKKLKE